MDILLGIILILHFIGLAALLGGVLVQIKDTIAGKGRIVAAMIHGALTQLVTGVALVGLIQAGGGEINNTKIAVKLAIVLIITALVFLFRKKNPVLSWVIWLIGALTVANIAIAVLWRSAHPDPGPNSAPAIRPPVQTRGGAGGTRRPEMAFTALCRALREPVS